MARTDVPNTAVSTSGVAAGAEVAGDSVNNHSFANTNGNVVLVVRNADTNPHNVTIRFAETVDGQAVTSRVVAVAAGVTKYFGTFTTGIYGTTVQVDVDSSQLKLTTYLI